MFDNHYIANRQTASQERNGVVGNDHRQRPASSMRKYPGQEMRFGPTEPQFALAKVESDRFFGSQMEKQKSPALRRTTNDGQRVSSESKNLSDNLGYLNVLEKPSPVSREPLPPNNPEVDQLSHVRRTATQNSLPIASDNPVSVASKGDLTTAFEIQLQNANVNCTDSVSGDGKHFHGTDNQETIQVLSANQRKARNIQPTQITDIRPPESNFANKEQTSFPNAWGPRTANLEPSDPFRTIREPSAPTIRQPREDNIPRSATEMSLTDPDDQAEEYSRQKKPDASSQDSIISGTKDQHVVQQNLQRISLGDLQPLASGEERPLKPFANRQNEGERLNVAPVLQVAPSSHDNTNKQQFSQKMPVIEESAFQEAQDRSLVSGDRRPRFGNEERQPSVQNSVSNANYTYTLATDSETWQNSLTLNEKVEPHRDNSFKHGSNANTVIKQSAERRDEGSSSTAVQAQELLLDETSTYESSDTQLISHDRAPQLEPENLKESINSEPFIVETKPRWQLPIFKGTKETKAPYRLFPKGKNNSSPSKKDKFFSFLKDTRATQVKLDDLSKEDIVIAVMGPTGSGKSTFVSLAASFDAGIGHDLESFTNDINIVKLSFPAISDYDIVFVDTPGFDDTHRSDTDILKMISDWLKKTYEKRILLSGLLYFHRISDNRMAGTPLKNLRMFEALCGENMLQNIILTTTMWDDVDEETGRERESELTAKYWRSMLEHGSITKRFLHTRISAFQVLEPLLDDANKRHSVLLQEEMVDMRKQLSATSAGQKLFSEMESLLAKQQVLLSKIRKEFKYHHQDQSTLQALMKEYHDLMDKRTLILNTMRELRLPLGQRFMRSLGMKLRFPW